MIKGQSIKDITIMNIYGPNNRALKYIEQNLTVKSKTVGQ